MTPQAKANELVSRFANHSMGTSVNSNLNSAKNCAFIAVEEIMKNIEATELYHKNSRALPHNKEYWNQVIKEIKHIQP